MLFQNRVQKIGLDDPRSREQRSPPIHFGVPSYQRSWVIESLVPDKPKTIPARLITGDLDEPAPVQDTNHGDSSNPNTDSIIRHNFAPPMRTIATPKSTARSSNTSTGDNWWNKI